MQKLTMQTPDITAENIEAISRLFPSVVTEKEDADGNIAPAVDFDLLKQLLSKSLVEDADERYRLDWPGKKASILKANTPIEKTLRPARDESVNFDTTENLYIEGDNFEVLKVLQESYLGKVKMIYIDPPYNTGKDFVYRDNFKVGKEEYEEGLEIMDEEGGKLVRNTDTNGRFHSDWLSMIYERLLVARDLLRDDGVIFMSIDDNEVHNLRKIADEVFGEENFIEQFNWIKTETPPNLSKKSKKMIEYILCYQKEQNDAKFKGIKSQSNSSNWLLNQTNKAWVLKFPANFVTTSIKDTVLPPGSYNTDSYEVELLDSVSIAWGVFCNEFRLQAKFKWTQSKLDEEVSRGTKISIPRIKFSPAYDKVDYEEAAPPNLINSKCWVWTNENAGTALEELMGIKVFDFPKPVSLVAYLVGFSIDEGDIVLDFFSWSATTAESVMGYFEHKIKFICIQIPEILDEKLAKSDAERQITRNAIQLLKSLWKPENICELWKERIRRAGKKIFEENKDKEWIDQLDIGFRVLKLDSSNMKDVYYHPTQITQAGLFELTSNIKDDRTSEDLLTQVILNLGLTLDLAIEKKTVAGHEVFFVAGNSLVACFDENVDFSIVDELAKSEPLKVVFRDSSFRTDADRINFETRFKKLSPESDVRVI